MHLCGNSICVGPGLQVWEARFRSVAAALELGSLHMQPKALEPVVMGSQNHVPNQHLSWLTKTKDKHQECCGCCDSVLSFSLGVLDLSLNDWIHSMCLKEARRFQLFSWLKHVVVQWRSAGAETVWRWVWSLLSDRRHLWRPRVCGCESEPRCMWKYVAVRVPDALPDMFTWTAPSGHLCLVKKEHFAWSLPSPHTLSNLLEL